MAKFRKRPVVIDAITFDEFVQYGKDNGANIVNGMPWSFKYNGHPITHENDECYLIPTLEGTHNFTPQDVLITGVRGEIYPCKRDIFIETYEVEGDSPTSSMSFGLAIEAMKKGARVARSGWNGKGMFVYLVSANSYPAQTGAAKSFFGEGALVPYNAYMAIKNVNDTVSTWVPSVNDCLSDDWQIV